MTGPIRPLVDRLGFGPSDRVAIMNCDDLGSSHSANIATAEALALGSATSATLMVPCQWAEDAVVRCRGFDLGVHLTLNCETRTGRWRPLTPGLTLVDKEGFLPATIDEVWRKADPHEVFEECRAQIDQALAWGCDVTHLDSHIGHMIQRTPEFFEVYMELARDYLLPVRLTGRNTEAFMGFPFRDRADKCGVVGPDELIYVRDGNGVGSRETVTRMLPRLKPGVSEMYAHPAVDSLEIRSLTEDWKQRVDDHAFLVTGDGFLAAVQDAGVTLIGYRPLRDLVRSVA